MMFINKRIRHAPGQAQHQNVRVSDSARLLASTLAGRVGCSTTLLLLYYADECNLAVWRAPRACPLPTCRCRHRSRHVEVALGLLAACHINVASPPLQIAGVADRRMGLVAQLAGKSSVSARESERAVPSVPMGVGALVLVS